MKTLIRTIFRPLLTLLEKEEGDYVYKPSHRTILLCVSAMFFFSPD